METLLERCKRPAASLRQAWWALPLRLIVGYGFMEHGFAKLALVLGGSGPFALDSILPRGATQSTN